MARKRTHVREYYRRHHGTSDTGGSVTDHDRGFEAADGLKKAASLSVSKSLKSHEPFYRGGNYWSLEVKDDGRVRYTLGNLSDAGWFWDGEQDQTLGFLARVAGEEKVRGQFLNEMAEEGVTLESFKPLIEEALKENDGLYQLSGDNVRWRFGEGDDPDYESEKEYLAEQGFTAEQAEKIVEEASNNYSVEFDDFEEEVGEEYKHYVHESLSKAKDLSSMLDEMQHLREVFDGEASNWLNSNFSSAVEDAKQNLYPKVK